MAEKLPPGVYDTQSMRSAYLPNGLEPNGIHYPDANGEWHSKSDSSSGTFMASPTRINSTMANGNQASTQSFRDPLGTNRKRDDSDARLFNGGDGLRASSSSMSESVNGTECRPLPDGENGVSPRDSDSAPVANGKEVEAEWIEQYEPGVYITLVALRDGSRDLKRVRFRYLRHTNLYMVFL